MKTIFLTILIFLPFYLSAENHATSLTPKQCKEGVHQQPNGIFAIYVFCDDALGTNIAVFANMLGAPLRGKYQLGKRFWQGELWAYDASSYYWLEDMKQLLIATSAIYGSGSLYMLDLEKQESRILYENKGAVSLDIIEVKDVITLRVETEHDAVETIKIAM